MIFMYPLTMPTVALKWTLRKKEVCQSIEQSFDMLKALLDQRKAELVKKASSLVEEKKDALTAQKKGCKVAQTEIQSLVEFVGRNIEITSDHDLMCICTQLQTKVEEEKKHHHQLSLEPSATADVFCNPPSPEDIPKLLGTVSTRPKPLLHGTTNTCELYPDASVSSCSYSYASRYL